ncbi:hypothetical protein [Nocardia thraciensis]
MPQLFSRQLSRLARVAVAGFAAVAAGWVMSGPAAAETAPFTCPQARTPDTVTGSGPGSTGDGPDVILAFEHGYFVLRSGAAAAEVLTPDSRLHPAERIQTGIDHTPAVQHCARITTLDPGVGTGPVSRWALELTTHRPSLNPAEPGETRVYRQIVTTRTDGDRTLISDITTET